MAPYKDNWLAEVGVIGALDFHRRNLRRFRPGSYEYIQLGEWMSERKRVQEE